MPEYDNSMSGVLFKNDKKTEDKHPDYRGFGEVNGVKVNISAWIKVAGAKAKSPGSKFMSLKFQEEDTDGVNQDRQPASQSNGGIPKEDVPF